MKHIGKAMTYMKDDIVFYSIESLIVPLVDYCNMAHTNQSQIFVEDY